MRGSFRKQRFRLDQPVNLPLRPGSGEPVGIVHILSAVKVGEPEPRLVIEGRNPLRHFRLEVGSLIKTDEERPVVHVQQPELQPTPVR